MSKTFPRMGWIIMVALLCVSLAILPACGGGGGGAGIPYMNDGIFIQETIGEVDTLDPAWAYDTASGEQIYYMYEGLLGYDGNETDQFVAALATDWYWVNSTSLRFNLRPAVQFSNGDTMDAYDVEYSFERNMVLDPDYGPIWMLYFPLLDVYSHGDVTGTDIDNAVEVVNSTCIQFNFVRAYPETTWFQILCGSWAAIISKDFCIANGDWPGSWGNWTNYTNPDKADLVLHDKACGTGPWKLELWTQPSEIKLLRNELYYKGNATVPFDRVITKFVDDWASRKLSLLAGLADLVYCPRTNVHDLDGVADVLAYSDLPTLSVDSFYFNHNISLPSDYDGSGLLDGFGIPYNFFNDTNVRKGLTYAFDWDLYITQAMWGEATQVGSPVIDGLTYFNPAANMYSKCLTLARTYLETSALGNLTSIGFRFTLVYNTGNLVRKAACEILAANLFAISPNIQITVLPKAWGGTLAMIRGRQWAMFQIGWLADYADPDNFVYPFMHSEGTFSGPSSYNNATVDALIAEGAICTNATRRQQIYYDLQQTWYLDLPGIILVQPLGRRFFTKYIHDFGYNPCNSGQPGPLYSMTKSNP
jgi:peptide/nickel transport system substrate-binding protein